MTGPRIDRKDLEEIVVEAARIDARERERLDPAEAAEILRELDVGPEHLPEAQRAVAERRLARLQARRRLLVAGLGGLGLVLVGGAVLLSARSHEQSLDAVGVSRAEIELDGQPAVGPIAHDPGAKLSFEVVLEHPPGSARLELTCRWIDPAGRERHLNRWKTQPIEHDHWPTHCRHEFDPRDVNGAWAVTMTLGDRELATGRFELK